MVSSRRLAREWALKILYQSDVGKMSVEESQTAALERLRREFVQRGSRAAAGSLLEEYILDAMTIHLADVIPKIHSSLDIAFRDCIGRLFAQTDYWRRLDLDFTFSRQSFVAALDTPRVQQPLVLPAEAAALPATVVQNSHLTSAEKDRLLAFLNWAREALPRVGLRAFTREVQLRRPEDASLKVTQQYVQEQWQTFTHSMTERWSGLAQVVQKPISDWLRVSNFTIRLVTGVHQHLDALDSALQSLTTGWSVDRQASVDRNILRIAAYEMCYMEGIPPSATINEAVELAKKYSTSESGRFVNGILGALTASQAGAPDRSGSLSASSMEEVDEADREIDMEEIADEEELAQVSTTG